MSESSRMRLELAIVAVVILLILLTMVGLVIDWPCRFCTGCVWGLEGWDVNGLARCNREP